MEGLAKVPELLYKEFSQYCGKEKVIMLPSLRKFRLRRVAKRKTKIPGSVGMVIGLVDFLEGHSYFSVWEKGYHGKLQPNDSKQHVLTVVVSFERSLKRQVVKVLFNYREIKLDSQSVFVAEVICRAAQLVNELGSS